MNSPKPVQVVIDEDKTPQSPTTSAKRSPNTTVPEDKTLASSPTATKRPASTAPSGGCDFGRQLSETKVKQNY